MTVDGGAMSDTRRATLTTVSSASFGGSVALLTLGVQAQSDGREANRTGAGPWLSDRRLAAPMRWNGRALGT